MSQARFMKQDVGARMTEGRRAVDPVDQVESLRTRVAELEKALAEARGAPDHSVYDLLEQLPIGVALVTSDGKFSWSNAENRKYTASAQVPARDPERGSRWKAWDETGQPLPVEQWPSSRALRGETVKPGIEFQYTDDSGGERWLRVSSAPYVGADGSVRGAICIVQDIDQQKRAEIALRESEERFRLMADSCPFLIWICDADGSLAFVNRAFGVFTGVFGEDARGQDWTSLVHPEDAPEVMAGFVGALRKRLPWNSQSRVRRADGTWRWLETQSTPRFSLSGEFLGAVGSSIDITERKEAESTVRESEQQLKLVTDSLPVLVSYIDRGYRYRLVNRHYTDWFGRRREEVISAHMAEVLGEAAFAELKPRIDRALGGETLTFEMLAPYASGTRHIEATYIPDRDESGIVQGFVALVSDISDRKRAEEALRESEARLKAAVLGSPNPIMLHAEDGEVIALSRSWCELSGYGATQLETCQQWLQLAYPSSYAVVQQRIERAFRSNDVLPNGELTLQTGSGEQRVWDFQAVPLGRLADGRKLLMSAAVDVTGRVRAEISLREQLTLIEAITNNATTALFIADEKQHCLFLNPAATALTGYTLEELRGKPVHEVLHHRRPDGSPYPFEQCPLTMAATENRQVQGEEMFIYKNGRFCPVSYSASPIRDGRGVAGVIIEVRDVSAEKRMIETLRRRTEELETILNVVPVPVWITADPHCKVIHGNRTATELIRVPPESNLTRLAQGVPGLQFFRRGELVNDRDLPMERAAETGLPQIEPELELHTPDGRRLVLSGSAVPLHDASGQVRGVVSAMMDITARKQGEERLRQSEARLRLAMQTGKIGLWDWDLVQDQLTWTDSLYEMHGISAEELGSSHEAFLRLVHTDDRERLQETLNKALQEGTPYQITLRVVRPDGRLMWLFTNAFVLQEDGRAVRVLGASLDITELKRVEEELRRVNQDLEQFAYTATHDLQEPLRGVKVFSELLARRYESRLDGQALKFLEIIRGSATRMELMIRDLLAYTQLAGPDLSVEVTDANECLRTTLANLSGAIADAGAEVSFENLPCVHIYSVHLQQLFQNLVANAIKYRYVHRLPRVHIRAGRQDDRWLFSVEDNGIGIEPEFKERIFGLFKRLHTADQFAGTGIGLAICQRIVERYHGRIWVESEPGRGSTFYFTLPSGGSRSGTAADPAGGGQ